MRFVVKAQGRRGQDVNMMMRGFVKIQTAKILCLHLQCLERIRTDVLKFTTGTGRQVNKMSDDLISRKAVLEILYDISDRNYGSLFGHGINKACDVIEHAETAFDKEKVIEELRSEAQRWHESGVKFKDENEKGVSAGFRLATHIVEKGGIE